METELMDCCNARSACAGFVLTAVITNACWLGFYVRKSATVYKLPALMEVLHVMNVGKDEVVQLLAKINDDLLLELQVRSWSLGNEESLGVEET